MESQMVLSYYNKTGDAATLSRAFPIMEVSTAEFDQKLDVLTNSFDRKSLFGGRRTVP